MYWSFFICIYIPFISSHIGIQSDTCFNVVVFNGAQSFKQRQTGGGGYMGRFDSFLRDEEKQRGLEKKYKILISAILFSSKQTSQMNTYNWNTHSQEKQRLWARSLPWSLRSVTATQQQWRNCAIVSFYLYRIIA